MKKGFTMIELIFVIVILGILAAVAIPRLAATRDDAEISKAATNIQTAISDVGSYYTSQGKFGTIAEMTNVPNPIMAKGSTCLTWGAGDDTEGNITVTPATAGLCDKVWKMPGLAQVKAQIGTGNALKFGGQGVVYTPAASTNTPSTPNTPAPANP